MLVSIHALREGDRYLYLGADGKIFNPRPARGATLAILHKNCVVSVSIHALREGRLWRS